MMRAGTSMDTHNKGGISEFETHQIQNSFRDYCMKYGEGSKKMKYAAFQDYLYTMGLKGLNQKIPNLCKIIDKDGSGVVTLDAFLCYLTENTSYEYNASDLNIALSTFDEDEEGVTNIDDIIRVFSNPDYEKELKGKVSESELAEIIETLAGKKLSLNVRGQKLLIKEVVQAIHGEA